MSWFFKNKSKPNIYSRSNPTELARCASEECSYGRRCSPLFVLNMPVTDDATPEIQKILQELIHCGMLKEDKIYSLDLLAVLSSAHPREMLMDFIMANGKLRDGAIYLRDAHRYGYNFRLTVSLLEDVIDYYQEHEGLCPFILKLPPQSEESLFGNCPALSQVCFRLVPSADVLHEPVSRTDYRNRDVFGRQEFYTVSCTREAASSSNIPIEKSSGVSPHKASHAVPWYERNQRLLAQENNGLINFLKKKGFRFSFDQEVYPGNLMCSKVTLSRSDNQDLIFRMVYLPDFSETCKYNIRLLLSGEGQLPRSWSMLPRQFDYGLHGYLLDLSGYMRHELVEFSASAALLEATLKLVYNHPRA